jgi:uncharacterized lipoprotein YajG
LKKFTHVSSLSLMIAATFLLAGCTREPSENNIKEAYIHEVEQTNNLTRKFGGDQLAIKVNELKKISCKESSLKDHFDCAVDIDTTLPLIGRHEQKTSLTLVKGDLGNGQQGWIVVR